MIDHLSLPVSNMAKSQLFYDKTLSALGYRPTMTVNEAEYIGVGYGLPDQDPIFWIGAGKSDPPEIIPIRPLVGHHIAFSAPNRAAVDRFHQAGLEAGGEDNGVPGLRPHYHPNYYGAFLSDPDGHHIEAVCHTPEENTP